MSAEDPTARGAVTTEASSTITEGISPTMGVETVVRT